MSNSQLSKLKSGIKSGTEEALNLSSNLIINSSYETNFRHKLLLTNTQVLRGCKAFANSSLANIELSKTEWHKIGQSGGFLNRILGPLLKTGFSLIKNVLKSFPKSLLIPLGLTAAASAINAAIHKKTSGSGTATLIISKINKSLEESGLLTRVVRETINNEAKELKGWFLAILLH